MPHYVLRLKFKPTVWLQIKALSPSVFTYAQFSSVQSLICVWLFATLWTAARQASLSVSNSRSLPKLMSIESAMPSNHLILCHPHLPQPSSFLASGSFQMSLFFTSGGQSIGTPASASVIPMNTQDLFPLEWTGSTSLQSKELSRVFTNHSSKASILWCSAFFLDQLTSIHDYWKNHSLDHLDLCWQSNVSAF